MYCHKCGAQTREGAKFCTRCGTQLLPPTRKPSEQTSGYQSVYQHPTPPPFEQERPYSPPPGLRPGPHYPFVSRPPFVGIIGEEREITLSVVVTLLTCGIYGLVWAYKIGSDLRNNLGGDYPRAGLDIFLSIITCGVWGVYLCYKYPTLINDIKQRAGMPKGDLPTISVLLAIFSYGFPFLWIVSVGLMQNELNRIWRALRGQGY